MNIKTTFHTNLDLVHGDKHGWPEQLPFRPCVGDLIESTYEHRTPFRLQLEVVRVVIRLEHYDGMPHDLFSRLDVELHLPKSRWKTLRDFYDFYERITGRKFI